MKVFVIALHVLICLSIVGVVLLQQGRGADIGAAFGAGASNTVFGSRGAGNFLTKLTTGFAIAFMLTSLTLAYVAVPRGIESVVGGAAVEDAASPLEEPATPLEAQPIEESASETQGEAPSGFESVESPKQADEPTGAPASKANPPVPSGDAPQH